MTIKRVFKTLEITNKLVQANNRKCIKQKRGVAIKKVICLLMLSFFGLTISLSYAEGPKAKQISLYNWKDYTDKSILEDFEKKTGIKVILKEYETKDMMISEIQSEPEKFDVIIATDTTVPLLKQYKLITVLDLSKIPNHKFIKKQYRNLAIDPDSKYSLAYMSGTSGLVINTGFVPADTNSWAILYDKRYKGKIALMDDYREAVAALLKYSNFSCNSTNPKELAAAEENVQLLHNNKVQFGDTLSNLEKVKSGELWIGEVYNGDMVTYAKGRKDIKYVFPKEGFPLTVDNFTISDYSKNKDEAHQLINFFLEPQNAAKFSQMFSYVTTVQAESFLSKEFLNNSVIYPPQNLLQKGELLKDLGKYEEEYIRIFNLLKQREKQQ